MYKVIGKMRQHKRFCVYFVLNFRSKDYIFKIKVFKSVYFEMRDRSCDWSMQKDFYFEIQIDALYGSQLRPVTVANDICPTLIFSFSKS